MSKSENASVEWSVRQIKEFIKWAKREGIVEISIGGVSVVFAPDYSKLPQDTMTANVEETAEERQKRIEKELFWSTA